MISQYFTTQYLFQTGFVNLRLSDKLFFWIAATLVLIAVAKFIYKMGVRDQLTKSLLIRWFWLCLTIGLLGLIWSAFRYEAVVSLSARIIVILIYLGGLVWAGYVIKYWCGTYRRLRKEQNEQQLKQKYM